MQAMNAASCLVRDADDMDSDAGSPPSVDQGRQVLVTGANGFVGRAACASLPAYGFRVLGAVRRIELERTVPAAQYLELACVDETTDWAAALDGTDCVVHLAARVHVMQEEAGNALSEYRRVNVGMTLNLARQAAAAGIRRFVFVSSIKVNGEATPVGRPFSPDDVPAPSDPYGVSKWEAERALLALAQESGMEVVIIRPPLVYGPGVRANFQKMVSWVARGLPLPFGSLENRRSLVALDNLVDFIAVCLCHPAAANQIFVVSDGEDMTMPELLQEVARIANRRLILLPIPAGMLRAVASLFGRKDYARRLLDSLQVDISKCRSLLGWTPPVRSRDALRKAVLGQ